jgi:hypothetical protein
VKILENKIVHNQISSFFEICKKCVSFQKINDVSKKRGIDTLIIDNLSDVCLYMHTTVNKKGRLLKITKLFHSVHRLFVKKNSITNLWLIHKYFSKWRGELLSEKKALILDIRTFEELHDDLKAKIIEYVEGNEYLENKMHEITMRGEKCNQCVKFVEEEEGGEAGEVGEVGGDINEESNDEFNTNTFNSIKDENVNKINQVPYIKIKHMMPNEEDKKNEEASYKSNKYDTVQIKNSIKEKDEEENINFNKSENGSNVQNNYHNNENEDILILDENLGGLEYYNYLEKMVHNYNIF